MNGKMIILACITGFLLDCIFGDPVWMYHPIRVIGNRIAEVVVQSDSCIRTKEEK